MPKQSCVLLVRYAIYLVLVFHACACATSSRPKRDERALCQLWMNDVLGPRFPGYDAYDGYIRTEFPERRIQFVHLVQWIDIWSKNAEVNGPQILQILGDPDYWASGERGGVSLVYVYHTATNQAPGMSLMVFDSKGKLTLIGWNSFNSIDHKRFQKFR